MRKSLLVSSLPPNSRQSVCTAVTSAPGTQSHHNQHRHPPCVPLPVFSTELCAQHFNSSHFSSWVWQWKQGSVTFGFHKGRSFLPTMTYEVGDFPNSKRAYNTQWPQHPLCRNNHKRVSDGFLALLVLKPGIKSLISFLEEGSMIQPPLDLIRGGHSQIIWVFCTSNL